jgi:hypothetical protein
MTQLKNFLEPLKKQANCLAAVLFFSGSSLNISLLMIDQIYSIVKLYMLILTIKM